MKKHIVSMIAFCSTVLFGGILYQTTYAIEAQTNEPETTMIQVESFEYLDEISTLNQIVNPCFLEELSTDHFQEIDSHHLGYRAFQFDHYILETNLQLNQMGIQEGKVMLYDNGVSSISEHFQFTIKSNKPIDHFMKNTKYVFDFSIEQLDQSAPVIQLTENQIELAYNASFNAEEYVASVMDTVDGEMEYTIDNPVDTRSSGHYMVTYSATDTSGNTATATLEVTVQEKPVILAGSASANTSGYIFEMIELINQTRAQYGLHPYTLDTGALGAVAQLRASEAMNYLHQVPLHYRPDGSSYRSALSEMGIPSTYAVELLTYVLHLIKD